MQNGLVWEGEMIVTLQKKKTRGSATLLLKRLCRRCQFELGDRFWYWDTPTYCRSGRVLEWQAFLSFISSRKKRACHLCHNYSKFEIGSFTRFRNLFYWISLSLSSCLYWSSFVGKTHWSALSIDTPSKLVSLCNKILSCYVEGSAAPHINNINDPYNIITYGAADPSAEIDVNCVELTSNYIILRSSLTST